MIIQRWNKCYEVIRQIRSTGGISEFLCIEQESQETYLLVRITDPTLAKRFTLFLEDQIKGTEFPDYKECFQSDGAFNAVFSYSGEKTLLDRLGGEHYTERERAEIVRGLLKQMLLRSPHPYFMRNSLQPDMITVADNLDVDWNYHLDESDTFDNCTMETVCRQLAEVIEYLFTLELKKKRYPLLNAYLFVLEDGKISDYLKLYREFMPVYKALCDKESGKIPKTCLQRLWEGLRKIADRPGSLKGYLRFGKRYIAKKLVFALTFLILLLPSLFIRFIYPWLQTRLDAQNQTVIQTMVIGSQDVEGYTGQGTLYDLKGNLLYQGEFAEGQFEGMGKLYSEAGGLIYEGEFVKGLYEGTGALYYKNGVTSYEGEFIKGLYEGTGKLYHKNGEISYEGEFVKGLYEGAGVLFYKNGMTSYEGEFIKGLYEGKGISYYKTGVTSYEGEFLQGKRSGSGREFDENGVLLYEGGFFRDRYEGEGTLYDNGQAVCQGSFHMGILKSGDGLFYDKQGNLIYQGSINNGIYDGQGKLYSEGILIYEGGFEEGSYHGSGRMYQEYTGILLYDGMFAQGEYDGEGRLYDGETGSLLYEGNFYQGLYDGQGKLYDPIYGYLIYEGGFREGQYDGQGKSYDSGILVYEGEFLLGAYNGRGMLYDLTTGTVIFNGVFYDNHPLTESDYPQEEDYPQEDYSQEEDYPQEENCPQEDCPQQEFCSPEEESEEG